MEELKGYVDIPKPEYKIGDTVVKKGREFCVFQAVIVGAKFSGEKGGWLYRLEGANSTTSTEEDSILYKL